MPPPATTATTPELDPFRFGWRFVKRQLPDGGEELEQVPLTMEDLLHPQEGDRTVQTSLHNRECAYLSEVFRTRPVGPPILFVTSDLLIDWGGGRRPRPWPRRGGVRGVAGGAEPVRGDIPPRRIRRPVPARCRDRFPGDARKRRDPQGPRVSSGRGASV